MYIHSCFRLLKLINSNDKLKFYCNVHNSRLLHGYRGEQKQSYSPSTGKSNSVEISYMYIVSLFTEVIKCA